MSSTLGPSNCRSFAGPSRTSPPSGTTTLTSMRVGNKPGLERNGRRKVRHSLSLCHFNAATTVFAAPRASLPPGRASAGSANVAAAAIIHAITHLIGHLQLFAMGRQQQLQRRQVDLPVGVLGAEDALEVAGDLLAVVDPDPLDQPVEPQANGRIRDTVRVGQLLERPGGEDEACDGRKV